MHEETEHRFVETAAPSSHPGPCMDRWLWKRELEQTDLGKGVMWHVIGLFVTEDGEPQCVEDKCCPEFTPKSVIMEADSLGRLHNLYVPSGFCTSHIQFLVVDFDCAYGDCPPPETQGNTWEITVKYRIAYLPPITYVEGGEVNTTFCCTCCECPVGEWDSSRTVTKSCPDGYQKCCPDTVTPIPPAPNAFSCMPERLTATITSETLGGYCASSGSGTLVYSEDDG